MPRPLNRPHLRLLHTRPIVRTIRLDRAVCGSHYPAARVTVSASDTGYVCDRNFGRWPLRPSSCRRIANKSPPQDGGWIAPSFTQQRRTPYEDFMSHPDPKHDPESTSYPDDYPPEVEAMDEDARHNKSETKPDGIKPAGWVR